jgi:hypothetical protein
VLKRKKRPGFCKKCGTVGRDEVEGRQRDGSLCAKTIRTAILSISITKINFLLHYLKWLDRGFNFSGEKSYIQRN